MNQKIWAFCIYSVMFEAIVWGVFGYAVFWQNHSGWWMVLAVALSSSQLKPKSFGIGSIDASDTTVLERIKSAM